MSCNQFLCHFYSQLSLKVPEIISAVGACCQRENQEKWSVTSPKHSWSNGQKQQYWIRGQYNQGAAHYWGTVRSSMCVGVSAPTKEGKAFQFQVIFTCHQRRGTLLARENNPTRGESVSVGSLEAGPILMTSLGFPSTPGNLYCLVVA